ncbi:outer membrane protein OmpA-like peptidoglycan-associated protein [Nonlabens xylanidelens]|uniref:Outer membrane protein OmpA-like peptidoglycan-associated protein n=1 Tax=Nonlabens xylanidelens TaxID=191564 RepID=A0A2S6IDW6_9FLAO|nr:OmpA family protein [Nonlabens xylanidelens]PPK92373.1 outer membrane protein OmpA-like peptidoglycan-associated protein [Nonlabens xylanidelens]
MFKKLSILIILFAFSFGHAQKGKLDKGNEKFKSLAFIEAQKIYLKLVEEGFASPEILAKLGDTYYFNDELQKAYKWYNQLFEKYEDNAKPEYFFRYAQSLKSVSRYDEADRLMSKFNSFKGFDVRSKMYSEEPNYLQIIDFQSGRFDVVNTKGINSYTVDFGPAFNESESQVVYATSRDSGSLVSRRHTWNDQPFLQLYTAKADETGKLSSPKRLSSNINTKFHESTPAITADGETMYFTRNNYDNGVYRQDIDGMNKLKIFRSYKKNGKWSKPVSLPFNNDEYSVAHPALSPDGKQLYFSSDMPGSVGYDINSDFTKSDIWVVDILEEGQFSEPRNLKNVNTPGRETFPFVSKSNTLYFASTGHQGLGGLDVFASSISPDGSTSKVINIGKPINTTNDDFAFIINDDTKIGYFTSNRPGGSGDDDIYRFIQLEDLRETCEVLVTGTVTDEKTGEPMNEATVMVMDANNNKVDQLVTGENGKYVFKLECGKQYFVRVEKEDYSSDEDLFSTPTKSGFMDVPLEIETARIAVADCDDIGPLLDIEQIYFDFDRFNIRKDAAFELAKIKVFMELYPLTKVEIRSHTDSRAPDDYNDVLSEKRAQSTRNWLISKGIDASRLTAKGFGERRLLNRCSNDVECSKEEHQLNRRSEFIVTGLDNYKNCD